MVPMIKKANQSSKKFYGELALEYDEMTGFEQRFSHERPFFRMLVERYNLKNAIDAGCGTGFHSLLLAQLGLHVTATDISEEMLSKTRKHAKEYSLNIKTINSTFPELKKTVHKKFASVFCMGNTLAHLLTEKDFFDSLKSFHKVMDSDGTMFLQILNYNRILAQHERIQSIKEANGKMFIRFYDYENKLLRFNILTIEKGQKGILHSLKSITLRPWKVSNVVRLLRKAGFAELKIFGSIALEKYDAHSSKDLFVIAHKITSKD